MCFLLLKNPPLNDFFSFRLSDLLCALLVEEVVLSGHDPEDVGLQALAAVGGGEHPVLRDDCSAAKVVVAQGHVLHGDLL